MSAKLKRRMDEDRIIRDSALSVVKADIAILRGDLDDKGVGRRVIDRISVGAVDVFDEAAALADNNRGILATLIGAVFVWFARNPIMAMFSDDLEDEDSEEGDLEDIDIDEADDHADYLGPH